MTKVYYELILKIISLIPPAKPLAVPEAVNQGMHNLFGLLGFFFPYEIFAPLFMFIIGLTVFRCAWAVFITFKK